MEEKECESRPGWDTYFINIMHAVAARATCDRGKSGCVITKDNRIISTGYVGAAPGMDHCDDAGHLMEKVITEDGTSSEHCVRTIHAEANAILQAGKFGIVLEDSTLYCKMTPCYRCARDIISVGIKRVVAENDYHRGQASKDMFKNADIEFVLLNQEVQTYEQK
jgi:dCMP deaminase